jgi:hypothetical protein
VAAASGGELAAEFGSSLQATEASQRAAIAALAKRIDLT